MSKLENDVYGVILAGGSGTRFWPKSRHTSPKQLCSIGDASDTMIEVTLGRLEGFIPPENRIIVTHKDQVLATKKIVGDRCLAVIAEPEAKNTAAALALAALEIRQKSEFKNPIMVSLHSDSVIKDVLEFKKVVANAVSLARDGFITLLGVIPKYPETGYGYIEKGDKLSHNTFGFKVASFKEKPNLETATEYLKRGCFYWNSGLFVWSIDTFMAEMSTYLPHTLDTLKDVLNQKSKLFSEMQAEELAPAYSKLMSIAIDNAILEKSKKVAVVDADFGWQDVGSWSALDQCFETDINGNLTYGDVLSIDTKNTTIDTDGSFVAAIGVENLVIVNAKNCILVCKKDRSQDVKKVVEYLKSEGRVHLV